ncbi:MAG: squalene/phytoene synthase family protein [Chloroflexota bacterium]
MSTTPLTPHQVRYLNTALNKVARTFAILPPFIDAVLADIMSLAYLVCRVVDSIEDCYQPFDWKQQRFHEVRQLLKTPSLAKEILTVWTDLDWPGLNEDEIALMQIHGGLELWRIYALIPQKFRTIIQRWVTEMAVGMENTINPVEPPATIVVGDVIVLDGAKDYDQYCYYVAGTVGYLQTDLLEAFYGFSTDIVKKLKQHCLAFGLGLQKTNIVKDFLEDFNRGVCFIPNSWLAEIKHQPFETKGAPIEWVKFVLTDVKTSLDEAAEYIGAIPYQTIGIRQATLLCLLPAYKTILLAAEKSHTLFTHEHQVKISRDTLSDCFKDAQLISQDNQLLWQYRDNVDNLFHSYLGERKKVV